MAFVENQPVSDDGTISEVELQQKQPSTSQQRQTEPPTSTEQTQIQPPQSKQQTQTNVATISLSQGIGTPPWGQLFSQNSWMDKISQPSPIPTIPQTSMESIEELMPPIPPLAPIVISPLPMIYNVPTAPSPPMVNVNQIIIMKLNKFHGCGYDNGITIGHGHDEHANSITIYDLERPKRCLHYGKETVIKFGGERTPFFNELNYEKGTLSGIDIGCFGDLADVCENMMVSKNCDDDVIYLLEKIMDYGDGNIGTIFGHLKYILFDNVLCNFKNCGDGIETVTDAYLTVYHFLDKMDVSGIGGQDNQQHVTCFIIEFFKRQIRLIIEMVIKQEHKTLMFVTKNKKKKINIEKKMKRMKKIKCGFNENEFDGVGYCGYNGKYRGGADGYFNDGFGGGFSGCNETYRGGADGYFNEDFGGKFGGGYYGGKMEYCDEYNVGGNCSRYGRDNYGRGGKDEYCDEYNVDDFNVNGNGIDINQRRLQLLQIITPEPIQKILDTKIPTLLHPHKKASALLEAMAKKDKGIRYILRLVKKLLKKNDKKIIIWFCNHIATGGEGGGCGFSKYRDEYFSIKKKFITNPALLKVMIKMEVPAIMKCINDIIVGLKSKEGEIMEIGKLVAQEKERENDEKQRKNKEEQLKNKKNKKKKKRKCEEGMGPRPPKKQRL